MLQGSWYIIECHVKVGTSSKNALFLYGDPVATLNRIVQELGSRRFGMESVLYTVSSGKYPSLLV